MWVIRKKSKNTCGRNRVGWRHLYDGMKLGAIITSSTGCHGFTYTNDMLAATKAPRRNKHVFKLCFSICCYYSQNNTFETPP